MYCKHFYKTTFYLKGHLNDTLLPPLLKVGGMVPLPPPLSFPTPLPQYDCGITADINCPIVRYPINSYWYLHDILQQAP